KIYFVQALKSFKECNYKTAKEDFTKAINFDDKTGESFAYRARCAIFLGDFDGNVLAGRSGSLTNVAPVGIISLEATLDNSRYDNSSPEYTTIATPFYCFEKAVNFNPGAVDADGDSLVYALVPGMNPDGTVNYVGTLKGDDPLDIKLNTFSFSSTTGQLAFVSKSIQRSLVVYRVTEYRDGILLGTSMREMTVVILPCDNNPAWGNISNPVDVVAVDSVTVRTCNGGHPIAFDIDPLDMDGNNIHMEVNGLPKDAQLDITDNDTRAPHSTFVWDVPEDTKDYYTFYVTYTDDACPISSKQTQAYTIRIAPESVFCEAMAAGCSSQGRVRVTTSSGSAATWGYDLFSNGAKVFGIAGLSGSSHTDSVAPGKYKVHVVNHWGCVADTFVDIPMNCEVADIPNAFSPNGDGVNDILYVRGANMKTMQLRIYNRWGQVVFETHDASIGWDGRFKGTESPIEAYAFVLSVVFNSGEVFEKQGNITLLK
ncbi:MAG: gliding motility-associated C-terminal domain-containing protein, partial [Sphingobacteriales bacterium]